MSTTVSFLESIALAPRRELGLLLPNSKAHIVSHVSPILLVPGVVAAASVFSEGHATHKVEVPEAIEACEARLARRPSLLEFRFLALSDRESVRRNVAVTLEQAIASQLTLVVIGSKVGGGRVTFGIRGDGGGAERGGQVRAIAVTQV